jgi:hypothetical protein
VDPHNPDREGCEREKMKSKSRPLLGSLIVATGLIMVGFSVPFTARILMPLFGNHHTVFYLIQGGYYFANNRVLNEWVSITTIAGLVVCAIGMQISGILTMGRPSRPN